MTRVKNNRFASRGQPHRDILSAYDDPVPNPYPEFEGEVFQMFQEDNLLPEDIRDPDEAERYRAWLERRSDWIRRARGALLGLAIGDAIGTSVEFCPRGTFPEVTDMVGGGPFRLKAGEFTDDTSMALCLAASLLEKGFDPQDQMRRYVDWMQNGYMSSNGRCFDVGVATRRALERFELTGDPWSGSASPDSAGNGCIMRLAPVPIFFLTDAKRAVHFSGMQARTTHLASECIAASRLLGELLVRALNGASKDAVLAEPEYAKGLPAKLKRAAMGEYRLKSRDQIRGSGYVVDSLEASLWSFYQTESFRDAVLTAVNLGGDADTTAAITGQLAGAYYGEDALPLQWRERLVMGTMIGELAESLVPVA